MPPSRADTVALKPEWQAEMDDLMVLLDRAALHPEADLFRRMPAEVRDLKP